MSTTDDVTEDAIRLARSWLSATAEGQTAKERRTTGRLAALVADPAGLELAVRFVDRVARPQDVRVAARELAGLTSGAAAGFLGPLDRAMLGVGALVAPVLPDVVVPAARLRLRSLVGHLVADDGPGLAAHLAAHARRGLPAQPQPARRGRAGGARGGRPAGAGDGPGRAARRGLRVRQGLRGGQPAVHVGHRRQRRPRGRAAASAVPDGGPARHVPQPRHGGVPRPRPHGAGVRAARLGPGAPRRRGGHRAAGLPAGRRRRPRRADRDRDRAPRGRWRPPQGAPGQGRQPGDGAGRGRAARLVAGARTAPRRRSTRPTCGWSTGPCDPARTRRAAGRRRQPQPVPRRRGPPARAAARASARRSTSRCSRAWRPRRPARCATRSARCSSTRRSSRGTTSTSRSPTWCGGWRRTPRARTSCTRSSRTGAAMDAQEAGVPRRAP